MSVCLCLYVSLSLCVRFSDRLQIDVTDSVSHWVDVTGCGHGIAIVTLPTLPRRLRLGPCYCGHIACYQFTIVNKGRRQQTVFATHAAATAAAVKSSKHRVTTVTITSLFSGKFISQTRHPHHIYLPRKTTNKSFNIIGRLPAKHNDWRLKYDDNDDDNDEFVVLLTLQCELLITSPVS